MPLKKKKIKKEEVGEGVGNSMKEHKEEMNLTVQLPDGAKIKKKEETVEKK